MGDQPCRQASAYTEETRATFPRVGFEQKLALW
jgi:hypothetical protein